jgi:tetratricopeptide (TPR) repeat protein
MQNDMLFQFGRVMISQGRFEDAKQLFLQYVGLFQGGLEDESVAMALKNIGVCFKKQGNLEEGLMYYERALEVARRLGLQQEIADNISNMGVIYKNQALRLQQAGDSTQAKQKLMAAEKCYLEARDIDRKTQNQKGLADDLNNLGIVYRHMQDRSKAIGAYQESMKVAEKIGSFDLMGKAEMNIGLIHGDSGNWDEDITHLQKSLTYLARGGTDQTYSTAVAKYNLGMAFFQKGDHRSAKTYLQEADKLLQRMQIRGDELSLNIKEYLQKCR